MSYRWSLSSFPLNDKADGKIKKFHQLRDRVFLIVNGMDSGYNLWIFSDCSCKLRHRDVRLGEGDTHKVFLEVE